MKQFIVLITLSFFYFTSFSQYSGATPWSNCFGKNASCKYVGCSDVIVKASSSSAVVVIIKKYDQVKKHVYISAGDIHTIELPDGTYEAFFYYGTDWNRNKRMSSSECSNLYGGFNSDENVTKDDFTVKGQSLTYTLYQVVGGNHQNKPSNLGEAL